jgi:7-cyano-7-deazaguanine synthase in queuosine biosynthesis
MYIMCIKVIAVPSDNLNTHNIHDLSLSWLGTAITLTHIIYMTAQDSERSCILCVLRLSLYQARTMRDRVYYVC